MLSGVRQTIQERGLGLSPTPNSGIACCVGPSSSGSNTMYSWGDINTMIATLTRSKMAETAAHALKGAGEVRTISPSQTNSTPSAVTVTRIGTSTGTLATTASTPKDDYQVTVEITQAGGRGVGAFIYTLDGGDVYSDEIAIPSGGTYTLSTAGLVFVFDTGTFDDGDTFAFTTTAPTSSLSQVMAAVDVALAAKTFEYLHIVHTPAPASSAVAQPSGSPPVVGVTGTPAGYYDLVIKITTGGLRGTAEFDWSLDGGATWEAEEVTTAATVALGSTGLTATFAATEYTVGAVTQPSGTPPVVGLTGTPLGAYDLVVKITLGGVRGTAEFDWSNDGGATWEATGVVTGATVALTGSGLTATFATGTYVLNDEYTAESTAPDPYVDEDEYTFNTYAPITAFLSALKTKLDTAEGDKFYTWALFQLPDTTDAILTLATASIENKRVMACGGFCELQSEIQDGIFKRGVAVAIGRRISSVKRDVSPAQVDELFGLRGVQSIYRNEENTPALTAARITCLRTRTRTGFYIEKPVTLAPADSDFRIIQNLRVMNLISATVDAALELYIEKDIPVDATTGKILETTAVAIDAEISAQIRLALGKMISGLTVRVDRNEDMLSSETLKVRVRAVPKSYPSFIEVDMGFENPALVAAST